MPFELILNLSSAKLNKFLDSKSNLKSRQTKIFNYLNFFNFISTVVYPPGVYPLWGGVRAGR